MVNEAFAGLVIACDDDSLELYHEQQRYDVERNKELAKKKMGDWVWFKVDPKEPTEVTEAGDMPRKWNSRLSPEGHILLDVNAVARNYREYPELKTTGEPFPNKPWSAEVDWLEDKDERLTRKRGVRLGIMHEVTVKVVVDDEANRGENDVTFHIMEVHYESPTKIQLQMAYSPWIQQILETQRPVEDRFIEPVQNREQGKMHQKNKDYGIILRSNEGIYFVWSRDSGLLFVASNKHQYLHLIVGDFVLFKRNVRKRENDIVAKDLEKARRNAARTRGVDTRRDLVEAQIQTRIQIPSPQELKRIERSKDRFISHHDDFMGELRLYITTLRRMAEDVGLTMEQLYGKKIKVWAGATNKTAVDMRLEGNCFWEVQAVDQHPFECEGDDDYQEPREDDSNSEAEDRFGHEDEERHD